MHENRAYILEVIRAGAKGYVLKDTPPRELVRAIEKVARGEPYFSTGVSEAVAHELVKNPQSFVKKDKTIGLSQREREVLGLIADGFSNKEIASQLFVSVRTVETHREHIMRKLDIHSAAGLTRYAIAKGIVPAKTGLLPD